jgi:hypothetical protein
MRHALLVIALVLALRVPYLDHPIQGDDAYYLLGAQHAQIDPLHPLHVRFSFEGQMVSMQGHTHGPFNAWYLGALLALCGDIDEIPFHAAYIPFSLIAALSALSLARRFTPHPLTATLLFLATPAFVINGNSLETDVPLLAFWLLATALYTADRPLWAILPLALAALTAYQSILLVPILLLYNRRHWLVALTPAFTIAAFQLSERSATGTLPAQVLTGYFTQYGFQSLLNKLRNAGALTTHLGWLIFPLATLPVHWRLAVPVGLAAACYDPNPLFWLPFGLGISFLASLRPRTDWLQQWIALFFAAALVLFFAGANRYLLPIALPVAILASHYRFARPAIALQFALSAALAFSNFEQWQAYRDFVTAPTGRLWINAEWGLRHYAEALGGLPLLRGQSVQPGDQILSSALKPSVGFTTGGGRTALVRQAEVYSTLPLCLNCLGSKSAYSTAERGLRAFDIPSGPLDRVKLEGIIAQRPTRSYLTMADPDATTQIVSGIYDLEGNEWRWMSDRGTVLLQRKPGPLTAKIYLPPQAPGRVVTLSVDGQTVLTKTLPGPGSYELTTSDLPPGQGDLSVTLSIDQPFQVPNDARRLGLILAAIGIR